MTVDETLNSLLVKSFKDLMQIEGKALITEEFKDISNNDMHIIEAIGIVKPKKMSEVAKLMSVTTSTATKAIDALCKKGYVNRKRNIEDKRIVQVSLTEKGKRAYDHHVQFHNKMIEHIKNGLTEKEMTVLIYSISKLVDYFHVIYNSEEKEVQEETSRTAMPHLTSRS